MTPNLSARPVSARRPTGFAACLALASVLGLSLCGTTTAQDNQAKPSPQEMPAAAPSADDERIRDRLEGIFAVTESMRGLRVSVRIGVVRLEGSPASPEAGKNAVEIAEKIPGVVYVSDGTVESRSLGERLAPSATKMFAWVRDAVLILPLFLVAALVVAGFWFLSRLVERADRLFASLTDNRLIQGVLRQVSRTLVLILGLYFALEILGATALVGTVLGTAGVVGLALGFAFRDIVENYLSSIMLSVRQPFRSKDLVRIGDSTGTVIRMTTRDTVLMTEEGNHLSLPNSLVFKSTILNYTRNPRRRFDVAVGVGTDVDLKEASRLGLDVLRCMAGVTDDPAPFARVENLGDSNVTLRFYGWVDQENSDYHKVVSESVRLIKSIMEEHGVDMPVPTYQVNLRRSTASPVAASTTPSTTASTPSADRIQDEAAGVDVAPERHIEEEVDRDRQVSDDKDLLDSAASSR